MNRACAAATGHARSRVVRSSEKSSQPTGRTHGGTRYLFDRITLDPERCFGKPCIRGLRMPVTSLLAHLASGMTIAEMLAEWPELEEEDFQHAFGYAAWATDEKTVHAPAPAP